jgi:GntR family transcriptional repressor for pyruvate dehydrogenase complex
MFERVKRLKVAEQVVGAIREAIVRGDYQEGDSLPSERELATQFGVNRSSVREAMLRLETWGLVRIKQGGATRVRNLLKGAGLQILPYLLAPGDQIDDALLDDILSVRVMFLAWTAERAAAAATPQDIKELEARVDQMLGVSDIERLQTLDFAFFERMVQAGNNRVLALFTDVLHEIYGHNGEHLLFLYAVPFDVSDHQRAVEAIAAGDQANAAAAMRAYGERGQEARYARAR